MKERRRVYIELPEGEGGGPGSRQCGLLRKSLYVTRDAAQNWECELGGILEELGLRRDNRARAGTPKRRGESAPQSMAMMSLSRLQGKTLSGRSESSKRGVRLGRADDRTSSGS